MVEPDRVRLSLRREVGRTASWWRESLGARDGRTLARTSLAGATNIGAATLDRWRLARFWCPCCESTTSAFLSTANALRRSPRAVCPSCGARSRHRGIALLLERRLDPVAVRSVLHFAPSASLLDVVRRLLPDARLTTTDRFRTDVDRPGEDIQALSFDGGMFDLILCNHVLEHVADDRAAMAELARVLAPGGTAMISVPGDWMRSETVVLPDDSLNGHHRDYGLDVVVGLGEAFDEVDVVVLGDVAILGLPGDPGLRRDERVFICRRSGP